MNFEVSDFTPEELGKMSSFGVPPISMRWTTPNGPTIGQVPLNQIQRGLTAIFDDEDSAKKYEMGILVQIQREMERLRENKDKFTSSDEVTF